MPPLRRRLRRGASSAGGSLSYPSERLHEEVAYLAHYLHWSYDAVMSMSHLERIGWVRHTARLNEEKSRAAASQPTDLASMIEATRRR